MKELYRYMTADTCLKVLESSSMRWAAPHTFNDLYDVQFDLQIDVKDKEVSNLVISSLWEIANDSIDFEPKNQWGNYWRDYLTNNRFDSYESFTQSVGPTILKSVKDFNNEWVKRKKKYQELLKKIKVLCFTTKPTNNSMWSYYGDDHKGVVLGFSTDAKVDQNFHLAKPVNYTQDIPKLLDSSFLGDFIIGKASFNLNTILDKMVYTKSMDWEKESELRIHSGFLGNSDDDYEHVEFSKYALISLFLGERISSKDKSKILAQLKTNYPHTSIYQATKDECKLELEMVEV